MTITLPGAAAADLSPSLNCPLVNKLRAVLASMRGRPSHSSSTRQPLPIRYPANFAGSAWTFARRKVGHVQAIDSNGGKRSRMIGFDGKLVWPAKCNCIGVNVAHIVEMLNVSPVPARAASLAQASDQPPQTFNESLLAASKAYSSTGCREPGWHRQRPPAETCFAGWRNYRHLLPHVRPVQSPAPPQKTVQQQVPLGKQPRLVNQALIRMQLPFREPDRSASHCDRPGNARWDTGYVFADRTEACSASR